MVYNVEEEVPEEIPYAIPDVGSTSRTVHVSAPTGAQRPITVNAPFVVSIRIRLLAGYVMAYHVPSLSKSPAKEYVFPVVPRFTNVPGVVRVSLSTYPIEVEVLTLAQKAFSPTRRSRSDMPRMSSDVTGRSVRGAGPVAGVEAIAVLAYGLKGDSLTGISIPAPADALRGYI
jgi:hypothetical protein